MWPEARTQLDLALDLWRRSVGPNDPRALRTQTYQVANFLNGGLTDQAEASLRDLMPRLEAGVRPGSARKRWRLCATRP
jgi:hypothetical protein